MAVWRLNNTQTQFNVDIDVAFGTLDIVMGWCRENCQGNWHVQGSTSPEWGNWYNFDFDNEVDFLTFTLRFK